MEILCSWLLNLLYIQPSSILVIMVNNRTLMFWDLFPEIITALLYTSNYLRIGFTLKLFFSLLIISTFLTFLILLHFLQSYKSEFFSWISHPQFTDSSTECQNIQIRTDLKFSEFRKFRVKLSHYLKDLLLKT